MTPRPGRSRIDRIALVVADLDRAEDDYVRTLGCTVSGRDHIPPALLELLRVRDARGRRSSLRLGHETIQLLEFTERRGRPYPLDSTSSDLWFQHLAIVVSDMAEAHRRVTSSDRFRPISRTGPVRLPERSGGVTAFKFRDADGHPLELLAFRSDRRPGFRATALGGGGPFLGVDHTALSVADTDASADFFRAVLGLAPGPSTVNSGATQEDLDDLDQVAVSVTPVGRDRPVPHLELLRYAAGTRRTIPRGTGSNDILATHSVVRVDSLGPVLRALANRGTPVAPGQVVVQPDGTRALLTTTPDGHRFLVEECDTDAGKTARDTRTR